MKKYPEDYEYPSEKKQRAIAKAADALTDADNASGEVYVANGFHSDKRLKKARRLLQEAVDLLQEFVDEG